MDLKNSTILITGGTNGIGLEFAKQLLALGSTVIVTGRDLNKLKQTKQQFPEIVAFQSDLNATNDIETLYKQVTTRFPELNIIINNAGIMRSVEVIDEKVNLDNVADEIETNFSGTIRMTHQFLPHLMTKKSAAIVNITSGLGFIPFITSPIYSGTKAGIHAYSQALRIKLKDTTVKIFEVAPPMTDKPLQTAIANAKNDRRAMKVSDMVQVSINGMLNDKYNIRPGLSNVMWWMSRIAPAFFTKMINRNIEKAKRKQ